MGAQDTLTQESTKSDGAAHPRSTPLRDVSASPPSQDDDLEYLRGQQQPAPQDGTPPRSTSDAPPARAHASSAHRISTATAALARRAALHELTSRCAAKRTVRPRIVRIGGFSYHPHAWRTLQLNAGPRVHDPHMR